MKILGVLWCQWPTIGSCCFPCKIRKTVSKHCCSFELQPNWRARHEPCECSGRVCIPAPHARHRKGGICVRWHHTLSQLVFEGTNRPTQNYWVMIPTNHFMKYVIGMIWNTPLGFPVFQERIIGNLLWLRNLSIMLFNFNSVLVTLQHCVSVRTHITWCVSVLLYLRQTFKHNDDVVMVLASVLIFWSYQYL